MSSTKQISWFTVVESLLSGRREEWDWMQDQMVRPWKDNVYVFAVHCQPLHLVETEFWKGGAANLEEVNSAYNLKQVAMTLNYQNGPPQHLNSYQLLPLLQHAHSYFSRRLSELHFLILPKMFAVSYSIAYLTWFRSMLEGDDHPAQHPQETSQVVIC